MLKGTKGKKITALTRVNPLNGHRHVPVGDGRRRQANFSLTSPQELTAWGGDEPDCCGFPWHRAVRAAIEISLGLTPSQITLQ